ncbi:MAG: nucleotidyl transferase AbiEii/AbiGii toxin family protein, partial [Candidatus Wildermuthbacteria bacterium]|nr:nucleotidyl transferase AbiEii/AbiGii toxin family protein [Candidatus Wildermuthbacteria bacterium]
MDKGILTKTQESFLQQAGENAFLARHFYLRGGTALAGFYLRHRYSEDLDFFSEEEFPTLGITVFLKSIKQKLGISKIDFQQSFNRNLFFLRIKGNILKTEFTYFLFPRIEKGISFGKLDIESIYDIAVDKVHTIVLKARARDYIDLFFIIREKGYTFEHLLLQAKAK